MEKVYHDPLEGNQKGPVLSSVLAKGRLGICDAEVFNTVAVSRTTPLRMWKLTRLLSSVPQGKSVD